MSIEEGIDNGFRMYADFTGADPRYREQPHDGPDSGPVLNTVIFSKENLMGYELPTPDNDPGYPDGNPKTAMGAQKPDPSVVPPVSILHLATAMMNGAEKYGPFNWREKSISTRPYVAAALRHLLAYLDGEDFSADTVEAGLPVHHLGHVMACCAILLDAESIGQLNDNRPVVSGITGEAVERYRTEKKL